MKKILFVLLIVALSVAEDQKSDDTTTTSADDTDAPGPNGKSFYLFGAIFRKFRRRLLGYNDPTPLFAGPSFPLYGYYNCPAYGCNPALNYNPAPYENPNYYHYAVNPAPLPAPYNPNVGYNLPQQQQQTQQATQQQSNVVIYHGQGQQQQNGYYPPNTPPGGPMPFQPQPLPPNNYVGNGNAGNIPVYPVNNFGNYPPTGPVIGPPMVPPYGPPVPVYGPPTGPGPCGPPPNYQCGLGR